MFKKPNIDKEDIEFYLNEYVLNDGDFFSIIKKIKVDKILKEEIATNWNPLTRSNQYLGWNLKVKLTFFIPDGLLDDEKEYFKEHKTGVIFQKEIERFNYNFKGDFLKKYLNYPINEFTYEGNVKEISENTQLTESIRKVLKEFNFVTGIVQNSVNNLVSKYFPYLNDEYHVGTKIYTPKDYKFLPKRKKGLPEELENLQEFLDEMITDSFITRVDLDFVKINETKYLYFKVFLNEGTN